MGHAALCFCINLDFIGIYVNGMRKPDVWSCPIKRLHVSNRAIPEHLLAEDLFILVSARWVWRWTPYFRASGSTFPHQVAADAERRARSQDDPGKCAGIGLMIAFDQALGVFQYDGFSLYDAVRRQPALAFPRLMEPREACRRNPTSRAARISSSRVEPLGKR